MKTRLRKLSVIGEFGLIEKIRRSAPSRAGVKTGIGDDTAVLATDKKADLLFTTDMLIEGRHFLRSRATAFEIGRKAVAVNLSDIAAMGGTPTYAVVAAGLPAGLSEHYLSELYRGMRAACRPFRVAIVGGDTNRSDKIILAVTLLGTAPSSGAVLRSGARLGDALFVTGTLGGSYASKKHLRFVPRLKESTYLVRHFKVHAMMDLSDGLASDIFRLASESRVGARLDEAAVPVSKAAGNARRALTDGEDFELLFAMGPREALRLEKNWPKRLTPVRRVGRVTARGKGVVLVGRDGKARPLHESGFDHYRKR